tara:strand:- start:1022 stop:1420 length:399 start_codon:yes stop_codon:yes gene_type:complete
LLILIISCDGDSNNITKDMSISNSNETKPIEGLPPGIPSFPHIFQGEFFIKNNSGSSGLSMYAKLGDLDSPIVITDKGSFKDLIIGPRILEDTENYIEFFLITENGETLKAKEVIKFEITPTIKTNILNLNF